MTRSELRTLVFTDLAGSTALKLERGDQAAGELIGRHRAHVSKLAAVGGGNIVDWAGDGCFLTFDTPSAAVTFALALQDAHRNDPELPQVRAGIHLGEVTVSENHVEGFAVDLASRVCALAMPGQVLMSRPAFDSARQRLRADGSDRPIAWRAHGAYLLKGADDPVEICEAGREGLAPLVAPGDSEKARRSVSDAQEDTLGWRPAVGLHVPGRANWVLEQPLGEGGFGEVWLASHEKTRARRVFKFCFEPERIRGLRREVVLFRLLRESLGARPDIAQIVDWEFDRAPYFIESEYTEGGDLRAWADAQGGLGNVPLDTRLELVAQAAEALGAAHSVGVLHKDIKPGNILVTAAAGRPQACLTDFGIGLITNRDALLGKNITSAGLTETLVESSTPSTGGGTRMYMAPELIEGKPASTLSDIYALGVVLYQSVIGDFSHAIGPGWERDITDDLIREDIAACVDGNPARRLAGASDLARRLRTLAKRRTDREREMQLVVQAEKAHRRRQQFIAISAIGIAVTIAVSVAALREAGLRRQETNARREAEHANTELARALDETEKARAESERLRKDAEYRTYVSEIRLAAVALEQANAAQARGILERIAPEHRGWEWGNLVLRAWPQAVRAASPIQATDGDHSLASVWSGREARFIRIIAAHNAPVQSVSFSPDGTLLASQGTDGLMAVTRWDDVTELWRRQAPFSGGGGPSFSHDGRWLVFPLTFDVVICDALTGVERARGAGHTDLIGLIGFTPDDRIVVSYSFDGTMRGWDAQTGAEKWRINRDVRMTSASGFTFSAVLGFVGDTAQLLIADRAGRLILLDGSTGEENGSAALQLEPGWRPVSVSPEGDTLIAYNEIDNLHKLFDLAAGQLPETGIYIAPGNWMRNAIISPDGSIAFIRGSLGGVVAFNLEKPGFGLATDSVLVSGISAFNGGDALAISPGGGYIAVPQAEGSIYIFGPQEEDKLGQAAMTHEGAAFVARFDPVHRRLVSADLNGGLIAWDLDRRTRLQTWKGHTDGITELEPLPDYSRWLTHSYDGTSAVWSIESVEPVGVVPNGIPKILAGGPKGPLVRLAASILSPRHFSPDGKRVSMGNGTAEVVVRDTSTLETVFTLEGLKAYPVQNYFTRNGQLIITHGYQEPFVKVWDAQTGKERFTLNAGRQIVTTAVSPDDSMLVGTTLSAEIFRWSLADGRELPRIQTPETASVPLSFSPDGGLLVTGGLNGTVYLWNAADGSPVTTLVGHSQNVLTCVFDPAGQRILTATLDNTVRVWDPRGNELANFDFGSDVYFADWSPDGTQVVVTTGDGSIHLLDSAPWTELVQFGDSEASIETRLDAWRGRAGSTP